MSVHLREQWAAVVEASMGPSVPLPDVLGPPLYRSMMSPGQRVIISHPDLEGAEVGGIITGEIPTAGIMVVRLDGMKAPSVVHVPLSMVKAANLDEVRLEMEHHVPDEFGSWACFDVAPRIEKKWGYPAVEGYYAPEGDVNKALDTERLYTHWWNVLPDGRILDATAGQWKRGQGNVEILPVHDARYILWEDVPVQRRDEALALTEWSHFTGKMAVAGVTPEQLAFMNRVRAECQQTFGDAMVCREVTQALHEEYGWEIEAGYYHGPGHDIRPTYGAFPGHRYVRMPDGTILDVTHDQYEPGMPLLVIPPGDPRQSWYVPIRSVTGSTWRGFSGEGRTIWNEHDVVILSQRRGRQRYFEVFIEGQNFRNFPRLDEAKAGVEAKVGPVTWKQEKMDKQWVEHYYFGWTPEFTDPLFVYYADI